MSDLVVALTGASGSIYAVRLLDVLRAAGHTVHLTISTAAAIVLEQELGLLVNLHDFDVRQLLPENRAASDHPLLRGLPQARAAGPAGNIVYHHFSDFRAGVASGSFLTGGMVICPCSMGTLASIAGGHSENLIQRAADVHLKERRRLILVPRETPLSTIQLDNMHRLSQAGATILPAMPGFYHGPHAIQDLVDFVVARICDHLQVEHNLCRRWGGSVEEE